MLGEEKYLGEEKRKFRHTKFHIKSPKVKNLRHEAGNKKFLKSLLGSMIKIKTCLSASEVHPDLSIAN